MRYQRAQLSLYWGRFLTGGSLTGLSFPGVAVERWLEIVASKVEIIAGDENRTRRAGSDYGISLCAKLLKEICQTTPDFQTKGVR